MMGYLKQITAFFFSYLDEVYGNKSFSLGNFQELSDKCVWPPAPCMLQQYSVLFGIQPNKLLCHACV